MSAISKQIKKHKNQYKPVKKKNNQKKDGQHEQEKQKSDIKKTIAGFLELPSEAVFNLPLITVLGRDELNVENFKSLVEYGDGVVRLNSKCGALKIEGKGLYIKKITSECVTVAGNIQKIEYL